MKNNLNDKHNKDLEHLDDDLNDEESIDLVKQFKDSVESYHGVRIDDNFNDDDDGEDGDGTDKFKGKSINTSESNLSEIDRVHAKSSGLFNKVCSILSGVGAALSATEIKSFLTAKKDKAKKQTIEQEKSAENTNNKSSNKKMKM